MMTFNFESSRMALVVQSVGFAPDFLDSYTNSYLRPMSQVQHLELF